MKRFVKKACFTIASVLLMLIGTAPSCPASSEILRMLLWDDYIAEDHQQNFVKLVKDKYGVDLKLEITNPAGDDDNLFPLLRDGKGDIISLVHSLPKDERFQLIKHKLILPLNLDNIPNYKNVTSTLWKSDYYTEGDKVYAAPVSHGIYGLAYNTALVTEPPDSWNILWDTRFRDKYSLGKDSFVENVSTAALAMGIHRNDIFDYKTLNTPDFQEKLAKLAVSAHSLWEGADKAEDLKGLSLAIVWGASLPQLEKMGEKWKMAEPKEGSTAWVGIHVLGYALENKPQLKQIAEEWLNYLLSDEFQMHIVRNVGSCPVTATIRDKLTPEENERLNLNDPAYFEKNRILNKSLEKKDREGLKRLWEKALKQRK